MANDNYGCFRDDGVNLITDHNIGFEATKGAGATTFLGLNGTRRTPTLITANGAINPHASAWYLFTKAGVAAMTLAAPTAGTDDGVTIELTNTTTDQDTVTATGLFADGAATVNLATWPAHAGGTLIIRAYNGLWYLLSNNLVVMS